MNVHAAGALRRLALFGALLAPIGCIVISRSLGIESRTFRGTDTTAVRGPLKVHLADGSTIVFVSGATVRSDTLRGVGMRWNPTLTAMVQVDRIALDSVVGAERFYDQYNPGRSLIYSTLLTGVGAIATAGAAVAIFGSCPTFYSDSADTVALEAEGFSYSITPLLEARDVDALRARPDSAGILRLHVLNEALETHYINHLELLEVSHRSDERIVPDERGRPVAVSAELRPATITDRAGRDLRETLGIHDGRVFSSDRHTLASVTLADMNDHIDITVPRGAAGDSVGIALRMRNSLLNTVLFYDYMLARPGARSIDWLADSLSRIGPSVALGRWYASRLGLRVLVRYGSEWRQVSRVPDYGPIAFRDAAIIVGAPPGDSIHIRLSFLADEWRIDRLAVAGRVRRVESRHIPVTSVRGSTGLLDTTARAAVIAADERRLQTSPGQQFTIDFDVGRARADSLRSFLLVSQGYYVEWVRGSWMKGERDRRTFVPSDSTLLEVVNSWRSQKDSMETQFYLSRVPVQ